MVPFRRPALLACCLAGSLVLSACARDETGEPPSIGTDTPATATETANAPAPAASGSTTPTATPTPTSTEATSSPGETETSGASGAVATPSVPCQLPVDGAAAERIEFAVPEGWQVEEGNCEFLDPFAEEVASDTEPDVALAIRVSEADFATAAGPEVALDEGARYVGARSGYQAVRIRGVATGEGVRSDGTPVLKWLVDLDAGTDEEGGTLVASATPSSGATFQEAAEALDQIAQTLRVVPPAVEESPIVLTRTEGGGTPWVATFDQATGCFALRVEPGDEPLDEVCAVSGDGDIAGAVLSDDGQRVAVGIAPPQAILVTGEEAGNEAGAVTVGLEGGAAFGFPASAQPIDVLAVDVTGETIANGTIE